jgi:hypothetical protein
LSFIKNLRQGRSWNIHDRKHEKKLPYPVASTMLLLLFFFSSAGLREAEIDWKTYRGEMGREKM